MSSGERPLVVQAAEHAANDAHEAAAATARAAIARASAPRAHASDDESVVVNSEGSLYVCNSGTGEYSRIAGSYAGGAGVTFAGKSLFALSNNSLYRVDAKSGDYVRLRDS